MSSTVEKIKERLSAEEVIGNYIKLDKAGSSLKAKCPFHNEKTPSFFVSPDRGGYYCFGCGAKGDIFNFVQAFEGVDFLGALKILAEKAGVEIERDNSETTRKRVRIFDILESASQFFQENLIKDNRPYEYLRKRGLSEETIKSWRIGFANNSWHDLENHLKAKGFSDAEMILAGLIKKGDKGYYDLFRSRIMFPLFDTAGRIVGFSGRIFGSEDKETPKYVNSPETEVFSKSHFLYGYNRAKNKIRIADYSILVEGQVDLIMAHQAGMINTVATSGTALTQSHLEMLNRLSHRIIMCFDADNAGAKAALRSTAMALEVGMEVKIAVLPGGHDPASLILESPKKFSEALKNTKFIVDFVIDNSVSESKGDEKNLIKLFNQRVIPLIASLQSSVDRSKYAAKVAHILKTREDVIWEDIKKAEISIKKELKEDNKAKDIPENKKIRDSGSAVRRLLSVYFWQESLKEPSINISSLKGEIEDILQDDDVNFETEKKKYEIDKNNLIIEAESYHMQSEFLEHELKEIVKLARKERLQDKLLNLTNELKVCEEKKDKKKAEEILKKCQELSLKLSSLKNN